MEKKTISALISFGVCLAAQAADIYSKNAEGLLTSDDVWNPAAPGASDVAVWKNAGNASRKNALGGNVSWQGIRVDADVTRNIIINASGTETLTLGTSGIDMSVAPTDSTQNLFDINTGVALGAAQVWNVAETSTGPTVDPRILTINGLISGATACTLTKAGSGALVINSANNSFDGGVVLSGGSLTGNADGAFGTGGMTVMDGARLIMQGGTSNDYIDDLATLILGNGAELALDFTGADLVAGLSLDGGSTWLANGTYDVTDLDALGTGTYTGVGSVTVVPEPATIGIMGFGLLVMVLIRRVQFA